MEVALGTGLLLLSVLLAFRALGVLFSDAIVWPLVLIASGGALIWRGSAARAGSEPAAGAAPRSSAPPRARTERPRSGARDGGRDLAHRRRDRARA